MARTGKKVSRMPAMTSQLPEPTIYDYDPAAHLRDVPRGQLQPPPVPSIVESFHRVSPLATGDPCWIGECNKGCGRTLVSAVTDPRAPADKYACGLCG